LDQTDQSSSEKEDIFHFISYVPVHGALYELDGLSNGPVNLGKIHYFFFFFDKTLGKRHSQLVCWFVLIYLFIKPGPCTEDDWLEKVRPVIQERMSRYTSAEIRFNLLALIKNREDVYRTRIGEIDERMRHASNTNNSGELMQLSEEREQLLQRIEMEKVKFKRYEVNMIWRFFSLQLFKYIYLNCFFLISAREFITKT
jgi:ubiquitin carboxyl-terminal hydrolase L5